MNSNLALATQFAEKIQKVKNIVQIVLFGSVARGEDTPNSDIDIAVVHNSADMFQLMNEINKNKPQKIQTTFIHVSKLAEETELVGALSGDGLLLYGSPIHIQEKRLGLKPKILLSYSLAELPQTEKVKVNRALYGSVSTSYSGNKKYTTKTKGISNEPGVQKINQGVLLIDRKKAPKIANSLKRFGVKVVEIPVWTY